MKTMVNDILEKGCDSCEYATGSQHDPEFYIPESLMTLIQRKTSGGSKTGASYFSVLKRRTVIDIGKI
jgi:hypothetical protein